MFTSLEDGLNSDQLSSLIYTPGEDPNSRKLSSVRTPFWLPFHLLPITDFPVASSAEEIICSNLWEAQIILPFVETVGRKLTLA